MSRYIDADLIPYKEIFVPSLYGKAVRRGKLDGLYASQEEIKAISSADVEKVSRGVWIIYGLFDDFLRCPFCGYTISQERVIDERIAYCGRCGANLRRIYHE